MESGDDLSPVAHTWGVTLGLVGALILLVLTVGAFAIDVMLGVGWLFVGVPITAVILYACGLVLFAPVAFITGGSKTKRAARVSAILSYPCTLAGLVFADADHTGVLDLRDDGLLFHSTGRKGQLFSWEKVGAFGVGREKGIVINTTDGQWMLVLSDLEGEVRDEWGAQLTARGVVKREPVDATWGDLG